MAAPALSLQLATAKLFQDIRTLYPDLSGPHKGATDYAILVLKDNPGIDEQLCQMLGKTVIVVAQLAEKADHRVTIRGNIGNLHWEKDHLSNSQGENLNFFERTFTIHIQPNEMDEELQFKLLSEVPGGKPRWSSGSNFTYKMSERGFISVINLPEKDNDPKVSFQK
jgi:hypothetical protein